MPARRGVPRAHAAPATGRAHRRDRAARAALALRVWSRRAFEARVCPLRCAQTAPDCRPGAPWRCARERTSTALAEPAPARDRRARPQALRRAPGAPGANAVQRARRTAPGAGAAARRSGRRRRGCQSRSRVGARPPGQVGGRQVDGDAALGKLELRRLDRRTHAVARLAHLGVGEADEWNWGRPLPRWTSTVTGGASIPKSSARA